jgi:hypothetical protein
MRKTKTIAVTRGHLVGSGKTKTEAKADLEKQIDWACKADLTHVEMRYGLIVMVVSTPHGWTQKVFDPRTVVEGREIAGTCEIGRDRDYTGVLASARLWAAQNAWTIGQIDDEEFIARAGLPENGSGFNTAADLRRWIKWQRNYAALIAEGKTPNEAHHLASGLAA